MSANEVTLDDAGLGLAAGDYLKIEGLVTAAAAGEEFRLGMSTVRIDDFTAYENGTVADIVVDALLEVRGTVDAQGAIVAEQVEFIDPSNVLIAANVQMVNPELGIVKALGITVFLTAATQLEDDSALDLQPFGLQDLAPGDRIVLNALYQSWAPRRLLAARLIREHPDGGVILQGPVSDFDPGARTLKILGFTVLTDPTNPDIAEFFHEAPRGTFVEAVGVQLGSGLMFAREVQWMDAGEAGRAPRGPRIGGRK